jgi:hypothetical protein
MPDREALKSAGEFFASLYQGLARSTGHASRLNRPALTKSARDSAPIPSPLAIISADVIESFGLARQIAVLTQCRREDAGRNVGCASGNQATENSDYAQAFWQVGIDRQFSGFISGDADRIAMEANPYDLIQHDFQVRSTART